jgi:enterochelin esterase-like enzyme
MTLSRNRLPFFYTLVALALAWAPAGCDKEAAPGGASTGSGGQPSGSGGAGSGGAAGQSGSGGGAGGSETPGSGGQAVVDSGAVTDNRPAPTDGTETTADGGYNGPGKLVCNPGSDGNGFHDMTAQGIPASPDYTLRAGVKTGTLTATAMFTSKIYPGPQFPYRIYTSANYSKDKPAVFMTFGDGNEYINNFKVPTLLDNLTDEGVVPPAVVLFINPPLPEPERHTIYYDPPTEKYGQFLFQEIIPAVIEPNYPVSKDPNAWVTGGHSASGAVGWSVLWHTDRYHKFFGHNASFGAADVAMYGNVNWAKLIMMSPKRDLRVSLVTAPVGKDLVDQRGDWTMINKGVADALAAKGNDYRFIIAPGGHDGGANSRPDFPTAMRWMFRGCAFAN